MSLDGVINAVATIETGVPGIRKAYDKAPVSLNTFPCFVNFPDTGDISRVPSARWATHHVKMLLYVLEGADLPSAEAELRPYLDSVLNQFDTHLTLGGYCSNSRITAYKYGVLTYGGKYYLGISFDIDITEITTLTFAA